MNIDSNTVVSIHYTLTDNDNNVIDSTSDGEPLAYLHGANNIIPGLERELQGKQAGDNVLATISPEEGYGMRNPALIQEVPITMFEGIERVEPGMQFHAEMEGQLHILTVTNVEGETVTIDGNHPLAEVTLNFNVDVVDVREATEEEISNGAAGTHQA